MKSLSPLITDYLGTRQGYDARAMFWITARNRATNALESLGLWQGDDHQTIRVDSENRLYYGAGGLVAIDPIRSGVGLDVQMQSVTLSAIPDETMALLRNYDSRFAPVEMHRAYLDPISGDLIGLERIFKGEVDEISVTVPADGGESEVRITCASAAVFLTKPLANSKSDEEMRRRSANDEFRKYAAIAGEISVWWGTGKYAPPTGPTITPRDLTEVTR